MYISGPPGTGKSALVEEVFKEMKLEETAKVVNINCVSMRSSRDIFGRLVEEFSDDSQIFKKSQAEVLRGIFLPKKQSANFYVVSLDEIDHLLNLDVEVLYTLFEWSMQKNSHLILIGIANALDLTDRFLPRLKAKNLKPHLLPFLPYTAAQITSVITTRLQSLLPCDHDGPENYTPFLHPAAIQLCSRKIGSQTGDLRKAFELVRRAIDIVETETQQKLDNENASIASPSKTPLVENTNLSSANTPKQPKRTLATAFTASTAPRATVAHIAKITSTSMGAGTKQRLQNLNLHQKAAICTLIALDRKRRDGSIFNTPSKSPSRAAPSAKRLFDTYVTLCRADNALPPLSSTEFRDVLSSLDTMGLISEVQGRGGRVTNGSSLLRTPSKSGFGTGSPSTPSRMGGIGDERGLACLVSEKEMGEHIESGGAGIEILRGMLRG
jgi:cell division control protein 6